MQKLKNLGRYYAIKDSQSGAVVIMNPSTKKDVPLQTNEKDQSKYWRLTDDDGKQIKIPQGEIENYFAGEMEQPAASTPQPPPNTSTQTVPSQQTAEAAAAAQARYAEQQAQRDAERKAREDERLAAKAKRDQERADIKAKKEADKAEAKAKREAERSKPKQKVSILNHFNVSQESYDKTMKEISESPLKPQIDEILAGDLAKDTVSKNGKVRAMLALGVPHSWIIQTVGIWPAYVHNVKKALNDRIARDKWRQDQALKRAQEEQAKNAVGQANGNAAVNVHPEPAAQ